LDPDNKKSGLDRVVVGVYPELSDFFDEFLQPYALAIPFYDGNLQEAFDRVSL
jgi:hypothetical protein